MVTKLQLQQALAKEKAASLKIKKALKDGESQLAKLTDHLTHAKAERDGFAKALNDLIQQNAREDLESIQKRFPVVARERQRLISERNDAIQQSADMRVAIATDRDNAVDKLQRRIDELESAHQQISPEHEELQRKNDDLSINNAHFEMQLKQWIERHNECHAECVQTAKLLKDERSRTKNLDAILERFDRDFTKLKSACHQHLIVSLDLPETKPDTEVCETSRFVYYLLDVLNGK